MYLWQLKYFPWRFHSTVNRGVCRVFETTNRAKLLDLDLYTEFQINTKYH